MEGKQKMARPNEFSRSTQQQALTRQKFRCASCGTRIYGLGFTGRAEHKYGEGAHAHHVRPIQYRGSASLDNCVILCQSCHYSVHEGGRYRTGTVIGRKSDYPHFNGQLSNIVVCPAPRITSKISVQKQRLRTVTILNYVQKRYIVRKHYRQWYLHRCQCQYNKNRFGKTIKDERLLS